MSNDHANDLPRPGFEPHRCLHHAGRMAEGRTGWPTGIRRRLPGLMAPVLLGAAMLAGCGGDAAGPDDDGRTSALQVAAGTGQRAAVTAALPQPLTVVALGADGEPVAGAVVQFTVSANGGSVSPSSATTDAQGRASTTWTLGTAAGGHTVTARAGGATAEFTAAADAGPPVGFSLAQDSFSLEPGMDSVLHYVALDAHGNPNTAARPAFTVDDPSIATVGESGGLVALAAGRTTVRATLAGIQDQATLIVGFRFVGIAVGYDHACATTAGSRLHCWGLTQDHQAGSSRGESCEGGACLRSPRIVTDDVAFAHVAPGHRHTCGVGGTGTLFCWGSNEQWALGLGPLDMSFRAEQPTAVDASRSYTTIAADEAYACALTTQGAAYCWGRPGALGAGPPPALPAPQPSPVAGGLAFASIYAAPTTACALTAAGEAYCWGANGNGQIGVGDKAPRNTPARAAAGMSFKAFALGGAHACAIGSDDRVYCWGSNSHGQLGVDVIAESLAPVPISSALTFTAIAAGATHTCGIASDGAAWCWGSNYDGQLGNGFVGSGWQPRAVAGGRSFTRIDAKRDFTCAIGTDARVWCWGDNDNGQVGDGTVLDRAAPVPVLGQM
jgi:alpha-tubulin suppressor-like RCC1 family protein